MESIKNFYKRLGLVLFRALSGAQDKAHFVINQWEMSNLELLMFRLRTIQSTTQLDSLFQLLVEHFIQPF